MNQIENVYTNKHKKWDFFSVEFINFDHLAREQKINSFFCVFFLFGCVKEAKLVLSSVAIEQVNLFENANIEFFVFFPIVRCGNIHLVIMIFDYNKRRNEKKLKETNALKST